MDIQVIQHKIYEIRNQRVMLDFELADLYGIATKVLNQAVKRNLERFEGEDFMFQLTKDEMNTFSRSQIVTLNENRRGTNFKYAPYAFTDLGVAMLSNVLNSPIAIEINRNIMRAFVMMRQMALGYEDLLRRVEALENSTNMKFTDIYQALNELQQVKQLPDRPRTRIGFVPDVFE